MIGWRRSRRPADLGPYPLETLRRDPSVRVAEEALDAEESGVQADDDEHVFLSRAHLLLSTRRRTVNRTIEHYFLPNGDSHAWKLAYTRTVALQKRTARRLRIRSARLDR